MIRRSLASLLFSIAVAGLGCGKGSAMGNGGGGAGGGDAGPYHCDGDCTCDKASASCTCQGGSTCASACEQPCSLGCDGMTKCDLTSPDGSRVDCPGAGCTAHVGDGATVTCGSHGVCEVFCAGDCTLDCPGSSLCLVHCSAGKSCTITSCDMPGSCPNEVSSCRTACPPTTG
jgi:hypothetical protein